ncbi:MAG: hypothetical protein M9944_06015 [Rhizobiaceae bacterium]|nr:hypothetical protein [Rhizobiaceae bacterium]
MGGTRINIQLSIPVSGTPDGKIYRYSRNPRSRFGRPAIASIEACAIEFQERQCPGGDHVFDEALSNLKAL